MTTQEDLGPTNAQRAQQQITTIRDVFDRSAGQIAKALPKHLSADRMLRTAMTSIQRTPKLLTCDIRSLIGAVMQAAQLGLELDTNLGFAYLVPFKDQVQLIPGYKGLVNLAYRSGLVLNVDSRIVRVGEEFEFEYGTNARIIHRPKLASAFDNEKAEQNVIASYCIAYLRGGERHFEVRSKAEIDAIRRRSKAGKDGPWVTDYEEMAKKTSTRPTCKLLPMSASADLQMAVALDEKAEAGIPQGLAELAPIDIDAFVITGEKRDMPTSATDAAKKKLDKLAAQQDPKAQPKGNKKCKECASMVDRLEAGLCRKCAPEWPGDRQPGEEG